MKISIIKRHARRGMRTNYRVIVGVVFSSLVLGWLPLLEWWSLPILYFISMPFHAGILGFYYDVYEGKPKGETPLVYDPATGDMVRPDHLTRERLRISTLLKPFSHGLKHYFKITGLLFMVGLFTMLWSLLLIVPGIIKAMSYSQAIYLLMNNPNLGIFEAIRASRELMDGKKTKYFLMLLSMLGWFLIPIIVYAVLYFFLLLSSGVQVNFVEMNYLSFDFILTPLQYVLQGRYDLALLDFLTWSYFAFFYMPYWWTIQGGFHRELAGDKSEDIIFKKRSPLLAKAIVALTALFVGVNIWISDNPVWALVRGEVGEVEKFVEDLFLSSPIELMGSFYWASGRFQIDGENISSSLSRQEVPINITDDTVIFFHLGTESSQEMFGGISIFDFTHTGQSAVHKLPVYEVRKYAEKWFNEVEGRFGTRDELEAVETMTIMGTHQVDYIVIDFLVINRFEPPERVGIGEKISFLGVVAVIDEVQNTPILTFPTLVVDPEWITDEYILKWVNTNREALLHFLSAEVNLTTGGRLNINTLPDTVLFQYRIFNSSTNSWDIVYLGLVSNEEIAWRRAASGGHTPAPSPLRTGNKNLSIQSPQGYYPIRELFADLAVAHLFSAHWGYWDIEHAISQETLQATTFFSLIPGGDVRHIPDMAAPVQDLSGLELLTNLEHLTLRGEFTDLSPILGLQYLTELVLPTSWEGEVSLGDFPNLQSLIFR